MGGTKNRTRGMEAHRSGKEGIDENSWRKNSLFSLKVATLDLRRSTADAVFDNKMVEELVLVAIGVCNESQILCGVCNSKAAVLSQP